MSFPFRGTGVAIVTPFNEDLSVDFNSLEKIIQHGINGKLEYLVVLGTTGESVTLCKEEKQEIINFCIEKVDGKIPVVIGLGGNCNSDVISAIEKQDFTNIAGLLSVTPYYNKPSQEGIYQHFKRISEASPVPVIIYNVPGRTGTNVTSETTLRLANDCKNIVATKEASGDINQITEMLINKPEGFEVLSGDDALSYSMLALGAKGVISVIANSHPLQFSNLVRYALNGEFEKARELQYKLFDYMNALFTEGNPSGVKSALANLGLCKNVVRMPLTTVSEEHGKVIDALLKKIE